MDKALVTRNINALSKKELITVSKDELDKRRKIISLTDKGRKAAIAVTNTMSRFGDFCDNAITAAEKKSLLKILGKQNDACHQTSSKK